MEEKSCFYAFKCRARSAVHLLTHGEKPVYTNSYMCNFLLSNLSHDFRSPVVSESHQPFDQPRSSIKSSSFL